MTGIIRSAVPSSNAVPLVRGLAAAAMAMEASCSTSHNEDLIDWMSSVVLKSKREWPVAAAAAARLSQQVAVVAPAAAGGIVPIAPTAPRPLAQWQYAA